MAWRIELYDEAADLGGYEAEAAFAVACDEQTDAVEALRRSGAADGVFVTAIELSPAEVASLDLKPGEVRRV